MSFNPNIHNIDKAGRRSRHRRLDPNAGVKHSTITRRLGPQGIDPKDVQNRVKTDRGWAVPYFKGESFEVIYELICRGNESGIIKNEKLDRCIRVMGGTLYITINGITGTLYKDQTYVIERDKEYSLASSGDADVEVLFCQGFDYEKTITHVSEPTAVNSMELIRTPKNLPVDKRSNSEVAKKTAERMKAMRDKRAKAKLQNSGGKDMDDVGQVQGMNPSPMGDPGEK